MADARSARSQSAHVRAWLPLLTPGTPDDTLAHRFVTSCRGNRIGVVCNVITMVLAVERVIVEGGIIDAQIHVSRFLGVYVCTIVQILLMRRHQDLRKCMLLLADASAGAEAFADADSKKAMALFALRGPWIRRAYVSAGVTTEVLLVYTLYRMQPRWVSFCGSPWPHRVAVLVEVYVTASCLNAFYILIPLILIVCFAGANVYDAIGRHLRAAPCTTLGPAVAATLLKAGMQFEDVVSGALPHIMFVVMAVPLVSTVVVLSRSDENLIYAVGTAPLIFVLFVPLCLAGERLQIARRRLLQRAARGPWLEEALSERRLRLGILVSSVADGGLLRGLGVGLLDRPACFQALKSWFSFVQMVLNLQK